MSRQLLLDAAVSFFNDLSNNATPTTLLSHFSTAHPIVIQHAPAFPINSRSRIFGSNAVRSYFDLLATHWTRSPVALNSTDADPNTSTVTADASITWTWRHSRRCWREDFICTICFDESLKIISLNVQTVSEPETCVMRAVDPGTGMNRGVGVGETAVGGVAGGVRREKPDVVREGRWDWSRHVWAERWSSPLPDQSAKTEL
ncbi:hypothetical protein AX17_006711 [Amanita inopinata Kibby_2008]|nr:hypothetical protein AX17_006711 [Amanita inopinata Kibby_2008]